MLCGAVLEKKSFYFCENSRNEQTRIIPESSLKVTTKILLYGDNREMLKEYYDFFSLVCCVIHIFIYPFGGSPIVNIMML